MLPREFSRRVRSHAERSKALDEAAWHRALLVVNHIRGALGGEPLDLDDLEDAPEPDGGSSSSDTADAWADLDRRLGKPA